jgi:hypothetical protein
MPDNFWLAFLDDFCTTLPFSSFQQKVLALTTAIVALLAGGRANGMALRCAAEERTQGQWRIDSV